MDIRVFIYLDCGFFFTWDTLYKKEKESLLKVIHTASFFALKS